MNLDDLTEIQSRYGKAMLEETINTHAPLLGKSAGIPKKKNGASVEQINVTPGVMAGGPIADGSNYRHATRGTISTMFAHRSLWVGIVKVPIGVAEATEGTGDGIRLLKQYKDEQMGSLVMQLEQSFFDNVIGTCSATSSAIAASAVTVTMYDVTRFREGMDYLWDDNGTVNENRFTVTAVTPGADGVSGTVAFSTAATGTITADEDSFIIDDSTNDRSLWSLSDLAGTGNVYTQTAAITGYHGTTLDHNNATYSAEAVLKLKTRMIQRGAPADLICFVSPKVEERHRALYGSSTYRRFNDDSTGKLDPFGKQQFEIAGMRTFVSPNIPAKKIFVVDPQTTYLRAYKEWESLMGSAPKVSEDSYNYLIAQHGHFQTVCRNRRGVGVLENIAFS